MSAKRRPAQILRPLRCCAQLAEKLGVYQNNCFEENTTSGGEIGTGMRVVFRYNQGVRHGMCKLDLRCFLKDLDDEQCDYLFYRCATQTMYFVELKKTQQWDKAFDQITKTIKHFEKKAKSDMDKKRIAGIIIGDNTPPKANLKLRDLENNFRKAGYHSFKKENNGTQIWMD